MHHRHSTRARLLSVVAASLLVAACGATTATDRAATSAPAAATAGSEQAASTGADRVDADGSENGATGIHVNGDWEVVVREPDGTVASTTTFHNDLTESGEFVLSEYFGQEDTRLERTYITVTETSALCEILDQSGCGFEATRQQVGATAVWTTTIEAPADGDFASVGTLTYTFYGDGPEGPFLRSLTERELDSPVEFVEGQTVEITVTLSFS